MRKHSRKFPVEVRRYPPGKNHHSSNEFDKVETIRVRLRAEQIGNFNPIFCQYKGKRTLVHSEAGDVSDPFRREEKYLESLFIEL